MLHRRVGKADRPALQHTRLQPIPLDNHQCVAACLAVLDRHHGCPAFQKATGIENCATGLPFDSPYSSERGDADAIPLQMARD